MQIYKKILEMWYKGSYSPYQCPNIPKLSMSNDDTWDMWQRTVLLNVVQKAKVQNVQVTFVWNVCLNEELSVNLYRNILLTFTDLSAWNDN